MSEAELCLRLEEFYRDWDIYKEVPGNGGRLDLYIKKGALWIAIEVKKQFTTGLIMQAYRNIPYAHYSYVAVPDLKNIYPGIQLCRLIGVGVIILRVHQSGLEEIQEVEKPKFNRRIEPLPILDIMKQAQAGVQHNSMSEFKVTLAHIVMWIKRNDGKLLIKEVFENNKYHYSSSKSAMQCITRLCRDGKIKEFKIDGKEFVLTETIDAK